MNFSLFFRLLWAVMAVVAGVGGLWSVAYAISKGRSSASWLPVRGEILTSRLVRGKWILEPQITYRYWCNDSAYEGERIRFLSFGSNVRTLVQPVIDRYRPTQDVTVFVNPTNPHQAVLEPGGQPGMALFMGAGAILFLVLGIYALAQSLAPLLRSSGAA